MSEQSNDGVTLPEWLVMLVGRQTIETEGLRDALKRAQEASASGHQRPGPAGPPPTD